MAAESFAPSGGGVTLAALGGDVAKYSGDTHAVFISHIAEESGIAQWLKAQLDRDFLGGLDIFVSSDRSTIGAGRRWLDDVQKALKEADLQIVLCSTASVAKPWVNFEAGAVWLRDVPVVPVCHSGLQPQGLPVPLSMLEGIELSNPEGLAKLYDSVGTALGLRTPNVDFPALATAAKTLESQLARSARHVDQVHRPRVLCAATEQYASPGFGFEKDVEILNRHFPGQVVVESALTSARLRDLLTSDRFDIVHLVANSNEETGAVIFSAVDESTGRPLGRADQMAPAGFAALLQESQTRLVVLATCKALLLAVEVYTVANMAASDREITGREAAEWSECFYRLIAQGKPVFKAFDLTRLQCDVPIRAIRHKDVVFLTSPSG
jgi:hypothetical protein